MFWLWMIFCLLFSCLLEVLLGFHRIVLPVLLSVIFYFACLLPWQRGILLYFVAAALLDSWFARTLPGNGLCLIGILLFAGLWRRFGNLNSLFSLLVPGIFIGLISGVMLNLNILSGQGRVSGTSLFFSCLYFFASMILLPAVWWLLEQGARLLALRRHEVFSPTLRPEEYSVREEAVDE